MNSNRLFVQTGLLKRLYQSQNATARITSALSIVMVSYLFSFLTLLPFDCTYFDPDSHRFSRGFSNNTKMAENFQESLHNISYQMLSLVILFNFLSQNRVFYS